MEYEGGGGGGEGDEFGKTSGEDGKSEGVISMGRDV